MHRSDLNKFLIVLAFALVGWALCAAIMGIGRAVTSLENALVIHAIAAPIIFAVLSHMYFERFNYTTPLQTAIVFLAVVVLMDTFLVALLLEKSWAMFGSLIGTWVPFALIFLSTYLTGTYLQRPMSIKSV